MYNKSIISVCLLLVAILACALTVQADSTVKLNLFDGSSIWWVAVQPTNDNGATAKVEVKDSRMSTFVTMAFYADWGFYTYSSTSGNGFKAPLSFRITSTSGDVLTTTVQSLVPGALIDTGASFSVGTSTTAPTAKPSVTKPTATVAPTKPTATVAPTKPTAAPTTKPVSTSKPTSAPTAKPAATVAPTKSTTAPTTKPTTAPTTKPSSTTDLCGIVPTSTEPIILLVPLYVYPGAAWDSLIAVASKVKIIAIINPSSGPLATVDSTYVTYMAKLKNAGIEMVGYVYTSYGVRALSAVQADINLYATKYPLVTGIFLDEGANDKSMLPFYTSVYNSIIAKSGYVHVILNPGVQPDQGYLAITTNIVIFENYASSLASTSFSSWVKCAPSAAQKSGYQYKFSGIVHTAAASSQGSHISTLHNMGMGLVYVTDGAGGCCTYNTLMSYLTSEVASIQSLNA